MSITAEQANRTTQFESLIQSVDQVLQEVQADTDAALLLGKYGLDVINTLVTINQSTFLPNVHHGRVIVPKEYRNASMVAVLPRVADEKPSLHPHATLLQPTPFRRRAMADQLESTSPGANHAKTVHKITETAIHHQSTHAKQALVTAGHEPLFHIGSLQYTSRRPPASVHFSSRPVVSFEQEAGSRVSALLRAALGAQSLVSVYDSETYARQPTEHMRYRTVLRSAYIGAIIMRHTITKKGLSIGEVRARGDDAILEVDSLRALHGITRDDLFAEYLDGAAPSAQESTLTDEMLNLTHVMATAYTTDGRRKPGSTQPKKPIDAHYLGLPS